MVIPAANGVMQFAAVLPDRVTSEVSERVNKFSLGMAATNCGLRIALDPVTGTMHVASQVIVPESPAAMTFVNRALCSAADRGGEAALALTAFIRGDQALDASLRRISPMRA